MTRTATHRQDSHAPPVPQPAAGSPIPFGVFPVRYAAAKLAKLRERWDGPLGRYLREFSPVVWPGVPPEALMGFTVIGSRDEDTAPGANRIFHEIGYFQTPAGPATDNAPNANPRAPYNHWGRLAKTTTTLELLGREGVTRPGGWRGVNAVPDQVAIGLQDLQDELLSLTRSLPEPLRAQRTSNSWAVACAFASFSAGPHGARDAIVPYRAAIEAAPDSLKFAAWLRALDAEWRRGVVLTPAGKHGNHAYTALRTWQKLASGNALALALGRPPEYLAWWPSMPAELQTSVVNAAYSVRV